MKKLAGTLLVSALLATLSVWLGPSLDGPEGSFVLWQLRVPRMLAGLSPPCNAPGPD